MTNDLTRFIDAQQNDYENALSEIRAGRKRSHWMWYIFPQIGGLGFSEMSRRYAIKDLQEAKEYLRHPVLGRRLKEISSVLLNLQENNATQIFGTPDDMKLRSSMTLFASVSDADEVFEKVLDKYFGGKRDEATLNRLGAF